MMRFLVPCLPVLALAFGVAAQPFNGIGPALSRGQAPSPSFDITKTPFAGCGVTIEQISCQHLASDGPGIFTTGLSINALCFSCPQYGASGQYLAVVLGKYDCKADSFTPSTLAASLNIAGTQQFNLHVEPGQGRYAVIDRFDPNFNYLGVWLSMRANASAAFPAATLVTGIVGATIGYADPSLGYFGGKLKLFYVGSVGGQQGLFMDDLNVATSSVAGLPVLVRKPKVATNIANSPTPVNGARGEVEGLWLAELNPTTNYNDMFFVPDLSPATVAHPVFVTPAWKNNGAVAGGRFFSGDGGTTWGKVAEAQGAWLVGGPIVAGKTLDLLAGAYGAPGNAVTTYFFAALGIGAPFNLGGFFGKMVLTITWTPLLGQASHDAEQLAKLSFLVPNDPGLTGLRLALQALSIEPARGIYMVTNNAWTR